ncbi:MAG: hypothetical protein R2844_21625 [Caldilineales bacterium]
MTTTNLPAWALEEAAAGDRERTAKAQQAGTAQIDWPEKKALRNWARQQGWPAPRFGFDGRFLDTMFADDDNFALALRGSGVVIRIPVQQYVLPQEELQAFDDLYEERSEEGRPTGWGLLVEDLREIRRAVEAGVVVEIDGQKLKSWNSFYTWAHGRYHMLEDGYDSWIGDDKS